MAFGTQKTSFRLATFPWPTGLHFHFHPPPIDPKNAVPSRWWTCRRNPSRLDAETSLASENRMGLLNRRNSVSTVVAANDEQSSSTTLRLRTTIHSSCLGGGTFGRRHWKPCCCCVLVLGVVGLVTSTSSTANDRLTPAFWQTPRGMSIFCRPQ